AGGEPGGDRGALDVPDAVAAAVALVAVGDEPLPRGGEEVHGGRHRADPANAVHFLAVEVVELQRPDAVLDGDRDDVLTVAGPAVVGLPHGAVVVLHDHGFGVAHGGDDEPLGEPLPVDLALDGEQHAPAVRGPHPDAGDQRLLDRLDGGLAAGLPVGDRHRVVSVVGVALAAGGEVAAVGGDLRLPVVRILRIAAGQRAARVVHPLVDLAVPDLIRGEDDRVRGVLVGHEPRAAGPAG